MTVDRSAVHLGGEAYPLPAANAPGALAVSLSRVHDRGPSADPLIVRVEPNVGAAPLLGVARVVADAGFGAARLVVGADDVALELAPRDRSRAVVRFDGVERGAWNVTIDVSTGDCDAILESGTLRPPGAGPASFALDTLPDVKPGEVGVLVVPHADATAADVASLLATFASTRLAKSLHPKLRFEWTPRPCPNDGKFGHAN